MYSIFRSVAGYFDAEWTHETTLKMLRYTPDFCFKLPGKHPVKVMGLNFKHPVGLAAGFDKDGKYLEPLSKLGCAFLEAGTVTPKAQPGHAKPRMFRAPKLHALINRMGFNNEGVDAFVERIQQTHFDGVLGVSIVPNMSTPTERVWLDYEYCLKRVYAHADYIAINISSPNTPGLRDLQHKSRFAALMAQFIEARKRLSDEHGRYIPFAVKVSPDEPDESIRGMAQCLVEQGLDGMILTNTTVSRVAFRGTQFEQSLGGASGRPLAARAMACLKLARAVVGNDLALIASGGIDSADEARARIRAGASLLQLYSGLVYEGPRLIRDIVKGLAN